MVMNDDDDDDDDPKKFFFRWNLAQLYLKMDKFSQFSSFLILLKNDYLNNLILIYIDSMRRKKGRKK